MHWGIYVPVWSNFLMIVCFEWQASCFESCEYCFVSNLSVVYLGDLFTCTQQMHWGIYVPVWTNFLMIVRFEWQASCFESCVYCFVSNLYVVYLGDLFTCTQQMHWGIYVPVWTNFLMIVCFEWQASCFESCEYCFVSNLSVVYLGDLFTCTQQMHWGIYVPVWTNFLMIVCFEWKRAASKVVCIVSNLSVVYLGDLFTCTQQMHWGILCACVN